MRLLQRDDANNYTLTDDLRADDIPPYAILSHTWGAVEVIYTDVQTSSNDWQQKVGYRKIQFCADQAKRHGLQHFWDDNASGGSTGAVCLRMQARQVPCASAWVKRQVQVAGLGEIPTAGPLSSQPFNDGPGNREKRVSGDDPKFAAREAAGNALMVGTWGRL
ncbi:uncharacterized protein B0I36DRAFT_397318 [Microdochium trichocladiopsis]|uniref:Heterokaryon incompatibility domain-containing protein n=1 Tax=Microdochium trichocladiopsis TaxID=1682393 RepID=A0A9P8XTP4_9PEZI|nr:uncharacterized protein B0I36DRAFT_397318 [Microdochium trichocladiopsis]KAH7016577.1 hypothetical protein B0I36DRAFT_397318 [Microdochium trichocladiopsis]